MPGHVGKREAYTKNMVSFRRSCTWMSCANSASSCGLASARWSVNLVEVAARALAEDVRIVGWGAEADGLGGAAKHVAHALCEVLQLVRHCLALDTARVAPGAIDLVKKNEIVPRTRGSLQGRVRLQEKVPVRPSVMPRSTTVPAFGLPDLSASSCFVAKKRVWWRLPTTTTVRRGRPLLRSSVE